MLWKPRNLIQANHLSSSTGLIHVMEPLGSDSIVKVTASCLCGQLVASCSIPKSNLPIDLWLCSCDTCRYTSGHLAITAVYSHSKLNIQGEAVRYTTSPGPRGLIRCFCGTCGTSVYEDSPAVECTGLCGGALTKTEGIVDVKGLIFVAATKDGGFRDWLPNLPALEMDQGSEEVGTYASKTQSSRTSATPDDKLQCACHCGGVQFYLTRPNEESYNMRAPYDDALVPHFKGDARWNAEDTKWWVSADGLRYAASICACNDCRKSSGYDLQTWAFIPQVNIFQPDGQPVDFSMGTLREYRSSDGVYRHFCGQCGATVFFRANIKPGLIDISTGLMKASSGSRAEGWLEWQTSRISWLEVAQNKPLFAALEAGLQAWQK